jgi:hypothetical protein
VGTKSIEKLSFLCCSDFDLNGQAIIQRLRRTLALEAFQRKRFDKKKKELD